MMRSVGLGSVVLLSSACFGEFGNFEPPTGSVGGSPDVDTPAGGSVPVGGDGQGAAGPVTEACGGFEDEDNDGLIDCQDPDCGGYQCVPALLGEGWTGPLQIVGADEVCGVAFPEPGPSGKLLGDNPCGCECDAPAAPSGCSAAVTVYEAAGCAGASDDAMVGPVATCSNLTASPASASVSVTFVGGTCIAGHDATASFAEIRTCAAQAGGGCAEGETCLRPSAPGGRTCFAQAGLATCGHPFDERLLLLEGPLAATTCSAADCSCGNAAGGSCTGGVTLNAEPCGTSGAQVPVAAPVGCADVTGAVVESVRYDGQAAGGSCPVAVLTDLERFGDVTTLCCASSL